MQVDTGTVDRSRIGWWALFALLIGILVYLFVSYLGTFVAALFVYYGVRPVHSRIEERIDRPNLAATVTLVAVVLPLLALLGYAVWTALPPLGSLADAIPGQYREAIQPYLSASSITAGGGPLDTLLENPRSLFGQGADPIGGLTDPLLGVLGALGNVLFRLFVLVGLVFYLLRDDRKLAALFRSEVADRDAAAYAYATAVDRDLQAVYFGNLLVVFVVAGLALVVYYGFSALAPSGLAIPLPIVLALLTGISSLIPIVVSKVIYVPLAAYLGLLAVRTDASLAYPAAFLVVSLLVLDLFPQVYVVPRIAGRRLHVGLVLLSYVFGTALFGWFGLFLGPLILVVLVQFVRIAFGDLLHGRPITPTVIALESTGSDPRSTADPAPGTDAGSIDEPAADGDSAAGESIDDRDAATADDEGSNGDVAGAAEADDDRDRSLPSTGENG